MLKSSHGFHCRPPTVRRVGGVLRVLGPPPVLSVEKEVRGSGVLKYIHQNDRRVADRFGAWCFLGNTGQLRKRGGSGPWTGLSALRGTARAGPATCGAWQVTGLLIAASDSHRAITV